MNKNEIVNNQNIVENQQISKNVLKKKNPFVRIIFFILKLLLTIFILLLLWFTFSALHKKSIYKTLPAGFSFIFHTDSVYKAVNPILDMEVIDKILSSDEKTASAIPLLMQIRKSPLRKNPFVAFTLSRKLDFALYSDNPEKIEWTGVCDLGFLSAFTRLSSFILPNIYIEGITASKLNNHYFYTITNENFNLYITFIRNLVVVSSNLENLEKAIRGNQDFSYGKEELNLITKKDGRAFKILADARKLMTDFTGTDDFLYQFSEILKKDTLSLVSFELNDSQILLNATLPFTEKSDDTKFEKIIELLKKDCSMPAVISQMSNLVQYYTIINLGNLQNLKDALFPIFPSKMKIDSQWKNASALSKSFLNNSLEELLFSWTGNECCVFGLEGLNDSVFAFQISNENNRKDVFAQLNSSIIVNDNTSLILNGAHLNRLMFPDFITGLLKSLKINLPSPYYMVLNDFIYFSQSPETLSAVYNSLKDGKRISKNPNWQTVSKDQKQETMLSLFYDLERSIPFFLKNNSVLSEILSLYSIGRFDVRLNDSKLSVSLDASGNKVRDTRIVSGFPIQLKDINDGNLFLGKNRKKETLFWLEKSKVVKSYQISSGKIFEKAFTTSVSICPNLNNKNDEVWVLTENGEVYLLNRELETKTGFPLLIERGTYGKPASSQNNLVIPMSGDKICFVSEEGEEEYIELEGSSSIKAEPFVYENTILLYEKGFIGKIFILDGKKIRNPDSPLLVNSIGFGSPVMYKKGPTEYIAFICQNGTLYLWENGILNNAFPIKLDGLFYTNLSYNGKYLFALSSAGQLFRISQDASFISIIIPNVQAKEGKITVDNSVKGFAGNIYLGIDGNIIYGFNENLELLSNFPLNGYGRPVFTDVSGDNREDCISLTLDKKLNAWNLQQ